MPIYFGFFVNFTGEHRTKKLAIVSTPHGRVLAYEKPAYDCTVVPGFYISEMLPPVSDDLFNFEIEPVPEEK